MAHLIKFAVVLSCLVIQACAIVDMREEVHYNYQGGRIAQPVLGEVIPGSTTRQWLLENLGEPMTETTQESESELIYQYDEHINTRTRVLFLFYYRSTKVVPRQLIIALRDNVVMRVGPSYFSEEE